MDDVLVPAPTGWKLKRAVKRLNETFDGLKLDKHPDNTFIGRIEKGFDSLRYYVSADGLVIAGWAMKKFIVKCDPALRARALRP